MDNDEPKLEDFFTPITEPPDTHASTESTESQESVATEEPPVIEEEPVIDNNNSESDSNVLNDFLKTKNINPDKISIYDELGNPTETKFEDLSKEEQIAILDQSNVNLSDSETSMIKYFRDNNISLQDYEKHIAEQTLANVKSDSNNIDMENIKDEDLYAAYMKNTNPDLTDVELSTIIDNAKQTPEVFAKITSKLRENLKENADLESQNKIQEELKNEETKQAQYYTDMQNIANSNVNSQFYGFDLTPEEHSATLGFLLNQNDLGQTQMDKLLENPEALYQAATLLVHGDKMLSYLQSQQKQEAPKPNKPSVVNSKVSVEKQATARELELAKQFGFKRK